MATIRGGDKFEAALAVLAHKLARKETLRVGFLENATYPNGTPVAMVAAIQNYGAPKVRIPPRPFFSSMVAAKSPGWAAALEANLKAVDNDADQALRRLGEGIRGQLQQAIIETDTPPLSPVTIMLRKMKSQNQALVVTRKTVGEAARRVAAGESTAGVSTKVLDETAHMLNSVDYDVKG
jgi:hypothetical protein